MKSSVVTDELRQAIAHYRHAVHVYSWHIATRPPVTTQEWLDQSRIYHEVMDTCRMRMLQLRPDFPTFPFT